MTTRIHSELRNLALAYYRGWVSRDRYLSIRQEYLQSITNGETPKAIDPKRIAPPKKKPIASKSSRKRSNKNKWILIAVTIAVLSLIIVSIYLGTASSPKRTVTTPVPDNHTEKATSLKSQSVTDEQRFNAFLTENFISRRTWDSDALNSLRLKWLGLSQEQQNKVSNTKVFQDFSGALIERIVDERKLNNIVPSDYELALMTAAKNMGMINAIPNP
ncbi:MAG: hypothetical protein OQL16_07180 [Gammaproteobacteria bacterium]|nr:hypothetical protein [Gammaproteobacteria bacterium]